MCGFVGGVNLGVVCLGVPCSGSRGEGCVRVINLTSGFFSSENILRHLNK